MTFDSSLFTQPLFTLGSHSISLAQILSIPTAILLGVFFIRWSARFLSRRMKKHNFSPDLIQMINRAYLIAAMIILVISTLDLMNVPLTAFAFISGAVAIGIGFGAQNIINNFISGWILMWEKPIRIGDFLEVCDSKGTVESINTRSTRIRRVDGVHMLIPNSQLLENTVVNWTLVDELTRTSVRVGIAYGSDIKLASRLIEQAAKDDIDVLLEPAPVVIFEDFGDNALVFDLNIWVEASSESKLRRIRSDIRYRIDELFREHAIVIAYPQRDIHIDGAISLVRDSKIKK